MTKRHVVDLHFKKEPARRLQLEYREVAHASRQARFLGRSKLEPVFDLSAYKCKAVIDWVDVELSLSRPTQFRYLQDIVGQVLPRVQWVKALNAGPGGTDVKFRVRVQQPRLAAVQAAINLAEAEYELDAPPRVTGLEVSVDFTPRDFSDDGRARMVGLLMWHLFPDWDYMSQQRDRPRFAWGTGKSNTRHLVPANNRVADQSEYVRYNIADRPAAVDATLYLGERKGPLLWSVQNKVTDRRNFTAGTIVTLAEKDRKARVEVTMGAGELAEVGIQTFADLRGFKFGRLQGRYFRVMLPTIRTEFSGAGVAAQAYFEQHRITKFKNTGVIGLTAMDEAREEFKRASRPEVVKVVRGAGKTVPPRIRTGTGTSMTLVAYEALGRRFETALRMLTERECVRRP